ncbi:MAG: glycosyltransferase family 39 protein [Acidobacteriota bacterium]
MINAGLADEQNQFRDEQGHITRATVLKVFAIIAAVSFILRIFYAWHLYEDDGLWFTAAEEIVRGKALYREIYFDKPPGLALVYALLFWIFGAHIITVRLFTIAYTVAISAVLYLFGSRLYDKRVGLLAAAMFAVFSTTYATGHVHGLGTDLLMAMPYTAGAFLLIRSRWHRWRVGSDKTHQAWLAMAGGVLVGVAFQINPKGIFDLIFFALFLIASRKRPVESTTQRGNAEGGTESGPVAGPGSKRESQFGLRLFALATAGFIAGSLPFLVYIAATRSLRAYWLYVWDWGARYGSYYDASKIVLSAVNRSADYFTLNNTLLVALLFLAAATIRRRGFASTADTAYDAEHQPAGFAARATLAERSNFQQDATLLIWFAVSYAGVMVGGRFFAHYFIQILPSLSLIGARGLTAILTSLGTRSPAFRRGVIAIIAIGFAFTMVRFHGRGVLLAVDFVRGTVSESNARSYHSVRNREERMVAAVVRDLPDGAADHLGLEAIRAGGPRMRTAGGPSDYVFVWGYRPEVYYWAGLLPASRYLSTQPLTGVPADVHYFGDDYRSLLDGAVTAEARAELARDLEETQPKYIVDEIGFFNGDLAILKYSELEGVMSEYKAIGATGRFLIYVRKELRKKYLLRNPPKQP